MLAHPPPGLREGPRSPDQSHEVQENIGRKLGGKGGRRRAIQRRAIQRRAVGGGSGAVAAERGEGVAAEHVGEEEEDLEEVDPSGRHGLSQILVIPLPIVLQIILIVT